MEQRRRDRARRRVRLRRSIGMVLVAAGFIGLFGGFFVPWSVVLADPEVAPAPESWVAVWLMVVGGVLAVWPARGRGPERE